MSVRSDVKRDERGSLGELLRLASPVVLSRLGIMTMGLTDAIVVGHYSSVELGYHALGWAPTMVVLTTGVGLLTGVQVLTAQLVGEKRQDEAGAVLRRGILFALGIGILAGLALYLGAPPFMRAIGLEASLADGAGRVAQVFALSMPTYLVSVALSFWLEALQKAVPSAVIMWTANIVNLAVNLWLVPGTSPFGIDGAEASATATFVARTALAAGLAGYVLWWTRARSDYGLFAAAPRAPGWRQLCRIGFATAGSLFVETTAFAGMNVVAGLLGALTAAAWAIVLNVTAVVFMVPLGLASATAVLVGRAYGERSAARVRRAGLLGFGVTFVVLAAITVVVALMPVLIVGAYTDEAALARLAAPAVALSSLFLIADGLQVVAANALRGRDDVWLPTLTHTISYAVVMLPLGYILAHNFGLGLMGIVWSVILASVLAAASLLSRFWWLSGTVRSEAQMQRIERRA